MKRSLFLSLLLSCFILTNTGCEEQEPLETVESVDVAQYLGLWYEIASIPQIFQIGCNCTTAEYQQENPGDPITVINRCNFLLPAGPVNEVIGTATPIDGTFSKLEVSFNGSPPGPYWILELGADYEYAVVGSPSRNSLWILSRTPQMDDELYDEILVRMSDKGFDVSRLDITNQNCNI